MKQTFIAIITAMSISAQVAGAQDAPKLRADNIDEVLSAMTFEEKAQLLVGGTSNFASTGALVGASAEAEPGAA